MYSITPVIYVWIGTSLPRWCKESLKFSSYNNPKRKFILISDSEKSRLDFAKDLINLEIISIRNGYNKSIIFQSKSLFKGKFWKFTSLRFEVLNNFLMGNNIKSFFHAEFDNLLFNFDGLEKKLDKVGNGFFVPRDNLDRGIGSFIYCNNKTCIEEILKKYLSTNNARNDMEALGLCLKEKNNFFSLPTESFHQNSENWNILNPVDCGGIFDAAAIGQYCLGIDPNNNRYKPTYNFFKNENLLIDFESEIITSNKKELYINYIANNERIKIYNLHVHSKNIKLAISFIRKGPLYYSFSSKKRKIIAHHHKIYFGSFIKLYDLIVLIIKRIIKRIIKTFLYAITKIYKNKN